MKMFRHDYIARNNELVFHSDFFENLQKEIFAAGGLQKLAPVITTAGNEMEFTTAMKSPQSFRHGDNIAQASISPALCSTKPVSQRTGDPLDGRDWQFRAKPGPPVQTPAVSPLVSSLPAPRRTSGSSMSSLIVATLPPRFQADISFANLCGHFTC